MRVFLSWSKRRSKAVAEAWHAFLPDVLQVVKTFLSSADLEAGVRWTADLADALGDMDHGIIIVTPENREEPWIHFEAGALSKKPGKSKVVPFLYDVDGSQIHASLAQFNYRPFTREGVFQIVTSINNDLGEFTLDPGRLQRAFDKHYPDFESKLKAIPPLTEDEQKDVKPDRKLEDMVAEILQLARTGQRRTGQTAREHAMAMHEAFRSIVNTALWHKQQLEKDGTRLDHAASTLRDELARFGDRWAMTANNRARIASMIATCNSMLQSPDNQSQDIVLFIQLGMDVLNSLPNAFGPPFGEITPILTPQ